MNADLQQLRSDAAQTSYSHSRCYRLVWRGRTLFVKRPNQPALDGIWVKNLDWAVACLRRSPVRRVKLGNCLTSADLLFWANVCAQANCEVYLSVPGDAHLPQKRKPVHWWFKCAIDKVVALLCLIVAAPILLGLMRLVRASTHESLFVREWHVGARGRLYPAFYLRTHSDDGTALAFASWVRRYRLDRLPKFFNVLRGEMSIVGACPRRLSEVSEIEPAFRDRFNALPGITGAWHLESRHALMDYGFLYCVDVQYLWSWSLRRDFGYLLLTTPKILVGDDF